MSAMTLYNVPDIVDGINAFGTQFSNTKYSATLGAGTEETVTVPSNTSMGSVSATTVNNRCLAVFSYKTGVNIWFALNATAAVPAGGTFASTTSELNPTAKIVKAGDVIHVITATATTDVGIAFYALPDA